MISSAQFGTVSSAEDGAGDPTLPARRSRRISVPAVICGTAILLWPFAVQSERTRDADDRNAARVCADWDLAAVEAVAKRLTIEEVGRNLYARAANVWLTEARRTCSSGQRDRAGLYYERIITSADQAG